jgi:hypothetical protein
MKGRDLSEKRERLWRNRLLDPNAANISFLELPDGIGRDGTLVSVPGSVSSYVKPRCAATRSLENELMIDSTCVRKASHETNPYCCAIARCASRKRPRSG